MKAAHEARVLEQMEMVHAPTKTAAARLILPLLEENRQTWLHCGPSSELARSQPHNQAAHAVWVSERLSVIVPNNRKLADLLEKYKDLFAPNEQTAVAAFLTHARSYELWVQDVVPYAAVKRFPIEFDNLIRGISNGGT